MELRLPDDGQQAEIWRTLAKFGVDPRSCRLSASSMPGYDWQVVHQPTGYVFYAAETDGYYHTLLYSFNKDNELVPLWIEGGEWIQVVKEIEKLCIEIKAYSADLQQREFDSNAAEAVYENSDNSRFTIAEQAEIASQLRMIKESLKENFRLSDEQMEHMEGCFNQAEEASRRMGRKDWVLLFSGAIFSLILTDTITPDVAQHIFTTFIHGAGNLFTAGGRIRGVLH